MSQFNTHGGYFAPKGYFKVDAGGSHDENPNGGVQIGVDQQGVPNMLEEGEPVYNDYVYSDNIKADVSMLEAHGIPKKYAGKLYSDIADKILEEAEERPNDPISNNGLNAMLVRLAEAQEEQKQMEQQQELEEEIANMSPEELAMLEQMLAQQGGAEVGEPAQEEFAPEMVEERAVPQMPMMANGGLLHKYDIGGNTKDDNAEKALQAMLSAKSLIAQEEAEYEAKRKAAQEKAEADVKARQYKRTARRLNREQRALEGRIKNAKFNILPNPKDQRTFDYLEHLKQQYDRVDSLKNRLAEQAKEIEASGNVVPVYTARSYQYEPTIYDVDLSTLAAPAVQSDSVSVATPVEQPASGLWMGGLFGNELRCGGKMNRYDWGSFMDRLGKYTNSKKAGRTSGTYAIDSKFPLAGFNTIADLEGSDAYKNFTQYVISNSSNPDVIEYLHALDAGTPENVAKLFTGDTLNKGWEQLYIKRRNDKKGGIYHFSGDSVDDLTSLITPASAEQQASAASVPSAQYSPKLLYSPIPTINFDETLDKTVPDYLKFSVDTPFSHTGTAYGTIQSGVKYDPYLGMDMRTPYEKFVESSMQDMRMHYPAVYASMHPEVKNPLGSENEPVVEVTGKKPEDEIIGEAGTNSAIYPTFPMYAGAIGSGLLALNTALQEPDKYELERVRPVTPYGRINIQHQAYNPIDQNMLENEAIAQGNATARALMNSGLGPSAGAALLASDAATQRARGEGFLQAWDANNQRRNQVIAANNAAEAQKAQFEFGVDSERANAINYANMMNQRYAMMIDQLNKQAESEKYAALSQNLSNALQALSDIGRQNATLNAVNTNRALYDQLFPGLIASYKGKV